MLAIGNESDDSIRRLTRGEDYTCCYGSETEHDQLASFCQQVQALVKSTGQKLSDFTPEELAAMLQAFAQEEVDL